MPRRSTGARLIGTWLPKVVERPGDLEARTELLRGACHAGAALGKSFLALGHALAQGLGGRYGAPHGALNALTLPAALRFNQPVAAEAIARFGEALGSDDPAAKVEELARLGGFERLRDLGIPEEAPAEVAETVAARPGAKANPRPVTPADVEALLALDLVTRLAGAGGDGSAGAGEEERVRLLELEAVRRLVGADERDERKLVELELRVVASLDHVHLRELPGDDSEHVLGARELHAQLAAEICSTGFSLPLRPLPTAA